MNPASIGTILTAGIGIVINSAISKIVGMDDLGFIFANFVDKNIYKIFCVTDVLSWTESLCVFRDRVPVIRHAYDSFHRR